MVHEWPCHDIFLKQSEQIKTRLLHIVGQSSLFIWSGYCVDVQCPTGMKLQLDEGLSDPGRAVLLT